MWGPGSTAQPQLWLQGRATSLSVAPVAAVFRFTFVGYGRGAAMWSCREQRGWGSCGCCTFSSPARAHTDIESVLPGVLRAAGAGPRGVVGAGGCDLTSPQRGIRAPNPSPAEGRQQPDSPCPPSPICTNTARTISGDARIEFCLQSPLKKSVSSYHRVC